MEESTVDDLYEALDDLISAIRKVDSADHAQARSRATQMLRGLMKQVLTGKTQAEPGNATEP